MGHVLRSEATENDCSRFFRRKEAARHAGRSPAWVDDRRHSGDHECNPHAATAGYYRRAVPTRAPAKKRKAGPLNPGRQKRLNLSWVVVALSVLAAAVALVLVATQAPASFPVLQRVALAATGLGPLTLVVTAYLVSRQLQEAAASRRGQLFDQTAGRMLDLDMVFVEHPELRSFFYEGASLEGASAATRSRVLSVAELHLDFFDSELLRRRTFAPLLDELPTIEPWIRGLLGTSPAMRYLLSVDLTRGEEAWYDEIHGVYAELVTDRSLSSHSPLPGSCSTSTPCPSTDPSTDSRLWDGSSAC